MRQRLHCGPPRVVRRADTSVERREVHATRTAHMVGMPCRPGPGGVSPRFTAASAAIVARHLPAAVEPPHAPRMQSAYTMRTAHDLQLVCSVEPAAGSTGSG